MLALRLRGSCLPLDGGGDESRGGEAPKRAENKPFPAPNPPAPMEDSLVGVLELEWLADLSPSRLKCLSAAVGWAREGSGALGGSGSKCKPV